ncbi:PAS domain-containing protein [Halogeometricum limi]|uniref:PAS domain S-box-containing protein n=1 Tax=Halogeometricum limi TaxID=555875 RepID=A0A1I6IJG7_9EURY|nr:PAS domain-containing protein [Halogeometricum limi]SFR66856.1 PAS domain S-box-containing protein [Halogeometricum limi]
MALRRTLATLFDADERTFRTEAKPLLREHGPGAARVERAVADGLAELDAGVDTDVRSGLTARERELVWRVWVFDDAPFGLTLSGPAYQDNPIRVANRTWRDLTGYSMSDLHGENPRLLQGAQTERPAVERLHEAVDIWESVTVELTNYRRDGTPFRNRVSLTPLEDESGTVTNWLGVQEAVGSRASE